MCSMHVAREEPHTCTCNSLALGRQWVGAKMSSRKHVLDDMHFVVKITSFYVVTLCFTLFYSYYLLQHASSSSSHFYHRAVPVLISEFMPTLRAGGT